MCLSKVCFKPLCHVLEALVGDHSVASSDLDRVEADALQKSCEESKARGGSCITIVRWLYAFNLLKHL